MRIAENTVVTLTYRITDAQGNLVDEGVNPLVYLHGGYDGIFPILEDHLQDKDVGDQLDLRMEPDDAFGDYDAELVRIEPRSRFPEAVTVGMQLEGSDEQVYTITDITEDKVVVDANHPLAGIALQFTCTVVDVRLATTEELSHGHVHGAHGHPHH